MILVLRSTASKEYTTDQQHDGILDVQFIIFDVYDFDYKEHKTGWKIIKAPFVFRNNQIDAAENFGVLKNYEIKIRMHLTIAVDD